MENKKHATQFVETANRELALELITPTTKSTPAVPLFKISGETYCKMIDILRMIHHEESEASDRKVQTVLSRMKIRLIRNDLVDPHAGSRNDNTTVPGRYAVGYPDGISYRYFKASDREGSQVFTRHSDQAKLYVSFRDASAARDFMDDDRCVVLDMYEFMSESDRFRRSLYVPYDADDGNEDSVRPELVP